MNRTLKIKLQYIAEFVAAVVVTAIIAGGTAGTPLGVVVGAVLMFFVGARHAKKLGRNLSWALLTPFVFGAVIVLCLPPVTKKG